MEIKTKYNVNDTVYLITTKNIIGSYKIIGMNIFIKEDSTLEIYYKIVESENQNLSYVTVTENSLTANKQQLQKELINRILES